MNRCYSTVTCTLPGKHQDSRVSIDVSNKEFHGVLQEETNETNNTKPAKEGRGVPYETEVNTVRGSTYRHHNQQHSRQSQPYSWK